MRRLERVGRWGAVLNALFCGKGQVVAGIVMLVATIVQTIYWTLLEAPTVMAVFLVSMEALAFAAYAVIATGLGMRVSERVEAQVDPNMEAKE